MKRSRLVVSLLGAVALTGLLPLAAQTPETLAVLTIGGGPRSRMNQVAIESNVRYVDSLLPKSATNRILFADGKPDTADVLYTQPDENISPAEQAVRIIIEGNTGGTQKFRKPTLRTIDGPTRKDALHSEVGRLAENAKGPVLLYFTGHGEPGRDLDNNFYDLWAGDQPAPTGRLTPEQRAAVMASILSVRELAAEIKRLPADRPVTVVMVQCYSGAFANLMYEDGDPTRPPIDRPFCGFFATTRERTAAGCTPEINEANYRDFTSYFFAALSGKDRTGKSVAPIDYDKNGVISMSEAYLYAVKNEESVDVPVSTSEMFLRRFVTVKDDEIAGMPYEKIRAMASPGQRDVMDALSAALKATGDDRLKTALADIRTRADEEENGPKTTRTTTVRDAMTALTDRRKQIATKFPQLASIESQEEYLKLRPEIIAYAEKQPELVEDVLKNFKLIQSAQQEKMADELVGARWLRLFRLAKTVVLEDQFRKTGDKEQVARFDKLRERENTNPLKG